jgi:hypothetical protein
VKNVQEIFAVTSHAFIELSEPKPRQDK